MGLLVEGKWVDQWYDTESTGGKFVRKDSSFRDWITRDGKIDDEDRKAYPAEVGRVPPLCFPSLSLGSENTYGKKIKGTRRYSWSFYCKSTYV